MMGLKGVRLGGILLRVRSGLSVRRVVGSSGRDRMRRGLRRVGTAGLRRLRAVGFRRTGASAAAKVGMRRGRFSGSSTRQGRRSRLAGSRRLGRRSLRVRVNGRNVRSGRSMDRGRSAASVLGLRAGRALEVSLRERAGRSRFRRRAALLRRVGRSRSLRTGKSRFVSRARRRRPQAGSSRRAASAMRAGVERGWAGTAGDRD